MIGHAHCYRPPLFLYKSLLKLFTISLQAMLRLPRDLPATSGQAPCCTPVIPAPKRHRDHTSECLRTNALSSFADGGQGPLNDGIDAVHAAVRRCMIEVGQPPIVLVYIHCNSLNSALFLFQASCGVSFSALPILIAVCSLCRVLMEAETEWWDSNSAPHCNGSEDCGATLTASPHFTSRMKRSQNRRHYIPSIAYSLSSETTFESMSSIGGTSSGSRGDQLKFARTGFGGCGRWQRQSPAACLVALLLETVALLSREDVRAMRAAAAAVAAVGRHFHQGAVSTMNSGMREKTPVPFSGYQMADSGAKDFRHRGSHTSSSVPSASEGIVTAWVSG